MHFDVTLLEFFERMENTLHGLPDAACTDEQYSHLCSATIWTRRHFRLRFEMIS